MTISTNETGGAFADGLTAVRIAVTPIIMALILWGWPDPQMAVLASILFIVAALTDIFDDYFGGASRSVHRRLGYLDDMADTVLVAGSLAALLAVVIREGMLHWSFAVPAVILITRELVVWGMRRRTLIVDGFPDDVLNNAKGGLAMLGTVLLVGAPWLTAWLNGVRAGDEGAMDAYATATPLIWSVGVVSLWIAMIFSLVSAVKILTQPRAESASQ